MELIRPMHEMVDHHGSCPGRDSLDETLGNAIGMVSSNSTECDGLILEIKVLPKLFRTKWVVISMITLECDAALTSKIFEVVLGLNRFASSE